jgi:cell division transport system permease protein
LFLRPDVPSNQVDAVDRLLDDMPEVKRHWYVNRDAAFREFKQVVNTDDIGKGVIRPEDIPTSFRVVPQKAELVDTIGSRFEAQPGVTDVVYAKETIDRLLDVTRTRQLAYLGVAAVLLVSATLLILNTIQLAIFSRRREVAVMKLVGATNWFIRLPFMIEAVAEGLLGAVLAVFALAILKNSFFNNFRSSLGFWPVITTQDFLTLIPWLLAGGVLVAILASWLAIATVLGNRLAGSDS